MLDIHPETLEEIARSGFLDLSDEELRAKVQQASPHLFNPDFVYADEDGVPFILREEDLAANS